MARPARLRCPYPRCVRKVADWPPSIARHLHQWHHVSVFDARMWAVRIARFETRTLSVVPAGPPAPEPLVADPAFHGALRQLLRVNVEPPAPWGPSIARPADGEPTEPLGGPVVALD